MAEPKISISIEVDDLAEKINALARAASSTGAGMKQMANQIRQASMQIGKTAMGSGVVSAGEHQALLEKFSRCSQRMALLLSLISVDELKRLELIPTDAPTDGSADAWDRVYVLNALDKRVDQFNAAHQRLTGQRKKVLDAGKIELTPEEMALVFAGRAAGLSTQEMIEKIQKGRSGTK